MYSEGCPRCLTAFSILPGGNQSRLYLHNDTAELTEGVVSGCWFCLKIFDSIRNSIGDLKILPQDLSSVHPNIKTTITQDDQMYYAQCTSATFPSNQKTDLLWPYDDVGCIFNYSEKEDGSSITMQTKMGNNTDSKASYEFITSEIEKCLNNHISCQQAATQWHPTRLLKLQHKGPEISINIVETKETPVSGPYVTLSHCWGGKVPLRLLTSNMKSFRENIPASDIPILYLDAAKVAMSCQVEYLWINSLCIIQDSREDWRAESALMSEVYQHGLFNIEAVFQKTCAESLFSNRNPRLLLPHETRGPEGRRLLWTENDDSYWATGRSVIEEPLYGRGWVLQERILSTRSVTFTRRQLFYRCAEVRTSEIEGLIHFPEEHRQGLQLLEHFSTTSLTPENALREWMKVLSSYNYTVLTFPGDKLVALSGLARKFGQVKKSPYMAGLWKDTLLHELLWSRTGSKGRMQTYRAPTWSWASVQTFEPRVPRELSTRCSICNPYVPEVLEVSTKPVGPDEFGEITHGFIRLKCHLYAVFQEEKFRTTGLSGSLGRAALENHIKTILAKLLKGSQSTYNPITTVDYDDTVLQTDFSLNECYIMPVSSLDKYGEVQEINALLLAAVTPGMGTYQRIGVCRIMGDVSLLLRQERNQLQRPGGIQRLANDQLSKQHKDGLCMPDGRMLQQFVSIMKDRGANVPAEASDSSGRVTITMV